jgi:hypothetical protein
MQGLALILAFLAFLAFGQLADADDLVIQSARVRGTRIHVTVRNDGPVASKPLSVALTTRAGGFMVGTAAHALPLLLPGARHEVELPLPIWAPERSDLLSVITQRGCCTTRVVVIPGEVAVEVEHLLPLPVGGDAP